MPEATEPSPWLDVEKVGAVIGADLLGNVDETALGSMIEAAADYVEHTARPDLATDAGYQPTPSVRVAAALLAYRLYSRLTSPLGLVTGSVEQGAVEIVRTDPDIKLLLGSSGFVFGGARR